MAERKFSELTAAAVLTDADILAISQIDSATASLMSKRTTLIAIANKLASLTNYTSELTTQDKTLTGAINELKGLISLIPHFGIEVVQTLPTQDISETTIYMTPSQNPQTQDAYDEFIYVNNAWEHVGSTAVDLSAYYTKLEVDGLLATKANTADVSAALALKENTADMEEDVTDIVVDLTDTIETAEGNPVTLQTVQEGYAKAVTIKLTPKQDLNGYDKPWPGGGGKNKINAPDVTLTQAGDIYNGTISLKAGTWTLSSSNTTASVTVEGETGTMPLTFTLASDINTIQIIANEAGAFNNIQIEAGATATAYEPYANICPIEGYEEASATRMGVNQYDSSKATLNYKVNGIGELSNDLGYAVSDFIRVLPSTDYYLKEVVNAGQWYTTALYDTNKNFIKTMNLSATSGTITTTADTAYIRFNMFKNKVEDACINYPATDTDYHAYDGATATAEFVETIYGATGDAAGGEWEKEYVIKRITSVSVVGESGKSATIYSVSPEAAGYSLAINPFLCNMLKPSNYSMNFNNHIHFANSATIAIYMSEAVGATKSEWATYLSENPLYICYKVKNPEPFQTAPAPLTLRKGDNTITTDGDSVKVKYNKLALPDIGGIGRYISALEARVAALEGNGNRSLSLMKSAPIETKETQEDTTEEIQEEPEEETKNENTSESK